MTRGNRPLENVQDILGEKGVGLGTPEVLWEGNFQEEQPQSPGISANPWTRRSTSFFLFVSMKGREYF